MRRIIFLIFYVCLVAGQHPGMDPKHHLHHLSDKWSDEWIGRCPHAVRPKLNLDNIVDPDPRYEFGNQLELDKKEGKASDHAKDRRRLQGMKVEDMSEREKILYYREKKHHRQKRRLDSKKQKRSKFIDGKEDKGKAQYHPDSKPLPFERRGGDEQGLRVLLVSIDNRYVYVCLNVYMSSCLSVYLSVCLYVNLCVYLMSVCLSICLSVCPSVCLSVYVFTLILT